MQDFLVEWRINISADTPEEAAQKAWEIMRRPDSTANCFHIIDDAGNETAVDLMEEGEDDNDP